MTLQEPQHRSKINTVQFTENLTDHQMADQVLARINLESLLNLTDAGFGFLVVQKSRRWLVYGNVGTLLLNTMLERFKAQGLVKARPAVNSAVTPPTPWRPAATLTVLN